MKKLMFAAVAVFAGGAWATDYVWTGAGAPNDQWAIPRNWSVNGVACTDEDAYPHATDDTATFNTDARVLVHNKVSINSFATRPLRMCAMSICKRVAFPVRVSCDWRTADASTSSTPRKSR